MRFGSICSGIEAASCAFGPLGWTAAWFAEIEAFPSAVLAHHYPETPNLGDMTALPGRIRAGEIEAPDMLCGGTPCQAFSLAGNRESLADARGNLTLTFCELADAIDDVRLGRGDDAAIVFWENVPGVLSTDDNAFGCFLGALVGAGAALVPGRDQRWTDAGVVAGPRRTAAWRILDAQFFGLAQRRRRVFVVASARDGFDPAAVLLERKGLRGHSSAGDEARQDVAGCLGARTGCSVGVQDAAAGHMIPQAFGGNKTSGPRDVASALSALSALSAHGGTGRHDFETETFVTHALTGEGFDASEDGTGRGTPLVPVLAFDTTQITSATNRSNPRSGDQCHTLAKGGHAPAIAFNARQDPISGPISGPIDTDAFTSAVAFQERDRADGRSLEIGGDKAYALTAPKGGGRAQERNVLTPTMSVRRLTPTECERLQGFPDGYTDIPVRGKPAADGPRYKALGNSWAVPCVAWIGRRIALELALETAA